MDDYWVVELVDAWVAKKDNVLVFSMAVGSVDEKAGLWVDDLVEHLVAALVDVLVDSKVVV